MGEIDHRLPAGRIHNPENLQLLLHTVWACSSQDTNTPLAPHQKFFLKKKTKRPLIDGHGQTWAQGVISRWLSLCRGWRSGQRASSQSSSNTIWPSPSSLISTSSHVPPASSSPPSWGTGEQTATILLGLVLLRVGVGVRGNQISQVWSLSFNLSIHLGQSNTKTKATGRHGILGAWGCWRPWQGL